MTPRIPNLQLLADEDLDGLQAWATALRDETEQHPSMAGWFDAAIDAAISEQWRRNADSPASDFPGFTGLSTDELVVIGQAIAAIHDAGSDIFTAWIEEVSDAAVAELASRMEDYA